MSIQSDANLVLANTSTNAGTLTLPAASSSQGRVITFKDSTGSFLTRTLTLQCAGSDTFEDGTTTKILRETFGTIQVVASGTKWYIISGTQINSLTVSTLTTTQFNVRQVSTLNTSLSSLQLLDNTGTPGTLFQQSTLLYYNTFLVAGARAAVGQVLQP